MLRFARNMTIPSALGYITWRLTKRTEPVRIALRSGERFELRRCSRAPLANGDCGVAWEVFVEEFYRDRAHFLSAENVRLIVDLGINVGFSVLYFLHRYPRATVLAFEPHPGHFAQANRNLMLDGTRSRVQLHRSAAGACNRSARLSDQGSSSSLSDDSSATLPIDVIDIFPYLADKSIDLFKMDIEGGEYEILGDGRFRSLDVRSVVMEWHARRDDDGREWCRRNLEALGFSVQEIWARPRAGMLWAYRKSVLPATKMAAHSS